MQLAIIKTGGKQYIVQEGDVLHVEKLEGEKGDAIAFDQVFLISDEEGKATKVGTPTVAGAKVEATIEVQGREKKVIGIKYKPKVRYRKKYGHRQPYTSVKIEKIVA